MQISDDIRDYWDLRSRGFSESVRFELSDTDRGLTGALLGAIDMVPGDRVLDVGCGPGYFALRLKDMGLCVTGIDVSTEMVARARDNAEEFGAEADFRVMDAQDMDLPDAIFDFVLSRNVLWNLPEPERAYREMFRVLRPGGTLGLLDGNYYLKREGRRDDRRPVDDIHQRFNTDGVDFSIMERISHDLPLSSIERPAWDAGVLSTIGCCSDFRVLLPERERADGGVPGAFAIIARKAA